MIMFLLDAGAFLGRTSLAVYNRIRNTESVILGVRARCRQQAPLHYVRSLSAPDYATLAYQTRIDKLGAIWPGAIGDESL